ncbi:MAG: hypothetical protein ACR2MX_11080 [Cyclobacteriaceae bacterium]
MKNLLLALIIAGFCGKLVGQDMTVVSKKVPVTDVVIDGWVATLNDESDVYKKSFGDFIKKEFDHKVKNEGKTAAKAEKISLNRISDKRGDLWLQFYTDGSDTKAAIGFLLGYDIWINPEEYADGMEQMRLLTRDFLRYHYSEYYTAIAEKDLKLINGYNKEISKAERSISNMRKQIDKNNNKLTTESNPTKRSNMERKNEQNLAEIAELTSSIPELQGKISSLDQHVQQTKALLKNVEDQYHNDTPMPTNKIMAEDEFDRSDELFDQEVIDNQEEENNEDDETGNY